MYFIKSILNNGMQEEIFYKYYEMFYKCVWMLEIGSSGLLLASV